MQPCVARARHLLKLRPWTEAGTGGSWRPFSSVIPAQAQDTGTGEARSDAASSKRDKVLVIGGSGFVGSAVCKAAVALLGSDPETPPSTAASLQNEHRVVSLSRSGLPPSLERHARSTGAGPSWVDSVQWLKGDVLRREQWDTILPSTVAVVSCVGAFGSREHMVRVNGTANVIAIDAAADAGVERFVFISAHDFGALGRLIPAGYYEGKKMAEHSLLSRFPSTGFILRPGMIHGTRLVGDYQIPLQLLGAPLQAALQRLQALQKLPVVGPSLVPPVPVASVGAAAAKAALGKLPPDSPRVLTVADILEAAEV